MNQAPFFGAQVTAFTRDIDKLAQLFLAVHGVWCSDDFNPKRRASPAPVLLKIQSGARNNRAKISSVREENNASASARSSAIIFGSNSPSTMCRNVISENAIDHRDEMGQVCSLRLRRDAQGKWFYQCGEGRFAKRAQAPARQW